MFFARVFKLTACAPILGRGDWVSCHRGAKISSQNVMHQHVYEYRRSQNVTYGLIFYYEWSQNVMYWLILEYLWSQKCDVLAHFLTTDGARMWCIGSFLTTNGGARMWCIGLFFTTGGDALNSVKFRLRL